MARAFNNLIMFKATIPYEFKLKENDYIYSTSVVLDSRLHKRQRRFIIHRDSIFLENQQVPATNSFFSKLVLPNLTYSYNISKIEIQLEIYEDEIDEILKCYSMGNEGINILSSILQNILLVFARIYNETMGGEDFFKPIVEYYGPFVSSLFLERKPNDSSGSIISVSYSLPKIKNEKELNIEDISLIQWRYYFNKAKNSYNLYDNLDTILSGAISMESYIIWLINTKGLKELFEEYKEGKNQVSFFQEVTFLKKNKILDTEKEKAINETFIKFKDYRNSIVHGDLDSPFIEREAATECINSLISFYKKYEETLI